VPSREHEVLKRVGDRCFRTVANGQIENHLLDSVGKDAVTAPGVYGYVIALIAEFTISFFSITTVLFVSNSERIARYAPYFAGALVAVYISFEAALSGMSMNPARTFGPAFRASYWHAVWIYFIAPTVGMLSAAEVFMRIRRGVPLIYAKLYHTNDKRCIFRCGYHQYRRMCTIGLKQIREHRAAPSSDRSEEFASLRYVFGMPRSNDAERAAKEN
jgi:hypothetical protein